MRVTVGDLEVTPGETGELDKPPTIGMRPSVPCLRKPCIS